MVVLIPCSINHLIQKYWYGDIDCDTKTTTKHFHTLNSDFMIFQSNVRTTSYDHFQDVRLISFDSKHIEWSAGDVLVVRPINSAEKVNDLFDLFSEHNLQLFPETLVQCQQLDPGNILTVENW